MIGRHVFAYSAALCVVLLLHAVVVGQDPAEVSRLTAELRGSSDQQTYTQAREVGRSLISAGRYKEAAGLFDLLVEKQSNEFAVVYLAALASFNAGRPERAELLVRRAVDIAFAAGDPPPPSHAANAADALVLMAVVLAVRNNDSEALNAAERAVRLAPNSFDAQFVHGRALFGSSDYAGAARAFRRAVNLKPSEAEAQFFLATALERSGDDAASLIVYRRLAKEFPQRVEGHLGIGVLLVKKGGASLNEGMDELQAALRINSRIYEARITLGRALVMSGRPAEALDHLKIAAELAPNNPEPHYQLSIAYRRLGRKQEAAAESAIVKRIHESRRTPTKSKPRAVP